MRLSKLFPKVSHEETRGSSQGELPVIAADVNKIDALMKLSNI